MSTTKNMYSAITEFELEENGTLFETDNDLLVLLLEYLTKRVAFLKRMPFFVGKIK